MMTDDPKSNQGLEQPAAYPPLAARSDTFDLVQLWHTVRQHYRFVLGVALTLFIGVMAITLAARMQFISVARVYLGEMEEGTPGGVANANGIDLSAGNQGAVGSEVEIIQSRSLVVRAILASGLNVGIIAVGHEPPRYGAWLLSRRNPYVLDVAAEQLRAKDSVLSDETGDDQRYTVRFLSDTEYAVWLGEARVGSGKLGEVAHLPGATLTLVKGSGSGPSKGSEYLVTVRPLQEVADATLKALLVTVPKPSPQTPPVNVVTLEFRASSPRLAASFLKSLIATYLDERQAWKVENATAAEAFVTNQLGAMRASLDSIQKKLADYRTNNRVVVLDNEAKAMIERIGKFEEQRMAARLELASLSEVKRMLKDPDAPVGAFLLGEANDTVLEGMANALATARQKLTDLESRFNDTSPDLQVQRTQVTAQLDSIRNYVASRSIRAQEKLATLDSIVGQYEQRLKTVPGAELGLVQLSRESEVYSRTYSYLLERQQQTAIIKASTLSKNRVLDAPEVARREGSPRLLLRLASGPLGLVVGVLIVLLRSVFATSLQTEADARSIAGNRPIFASVPRRLKRRGEPRGVLGPGSFDVLAGDTHSSFTEAFRTLRTHLYRTGSGDQGRVLLLTSPNEGAGKTTCTMALAAVLAADGKRVLVIDADLRKPNHPPASSAPGLCDLLAGDCSWNEVVHEVTLAAGGFDAIGSGGIGSAELLSSGGMTDVLDRARRDYDFVLVDAASFPRASDALVLAALVDCVLGVFRLESTSRKAAQEHLRDLTPSARAYGILINDVGVSRASGRPAAPSSARRPPVSAAEDVQALNQFGRRRVSAWWLAGLLLLTATGAFFLAHTHALSASAHTAPRPTRVD
jgi:tyrosine-protein kinase Etk/Wzc